MGESPFQAAIAKLLPPLEFAARVEPSVLERSPSLARTVAAGARRAAALAVPPDVRKLLAHWADRLEEPPASADPASELAACRAALRPLLEPGWSEACLARTPEVLPGVGARRAQTLARRELRSVEDLLFHLPARYDDRRARASVGSLEVGTRATFVARVLVADFVSGPPRRERSWGRRFEAVVGDDTGTVGLKWFRGGDAIAKVVRKDAWLLVTGDVKRYRFSKELHHPEVEPLDGADAAPSSPDGLVPDYVTPEGTHPRWMRATVGRAVERYADLVVGHLPEAVASREGLPAPADALRALHLPAPDADAAALREGSSPARARLVLEELYLLELGLALRRAARGREPGIGIAGDGPRTREAPGSLPFALTGAQRRAWDEIRADLARPHPMNRLLEGDVGSGKTVLAFLAAVAVAESGYQSALMAPTELLAEQHARTLAKLAEAAREATGLRTALLTSSVPRVEADAVRAALAAGELDLVIGTHALLQGSVTFRRFAFAVIDEQHRFGVRQRAALAAKSAGGLAPNVLVMTATPIPRTLALTAYGDLDLSVLDELPPGREPALTLLLRPAEGERAARLLGETVARGEQVYVVYPLVEESEKSDLRAASESAERIRRAFPGVSVDLVHGRLDAAARGEAMARFEAGDTQVLVSTTVIEVGVDVPNATLMIVEHAERFGLAQLHQLRGRVGRGSKRGTCALMARGFTEDSEARLAALLATTDGFRIAEADLRIRGPGEFLGTRQHGRLPDLRLADLVRDARWVACAREAALAAVREDPGLQGAPGLLRAVRQRWGDRLELAGIG
ncbi:MAG: ATP-dependent DNA helicase RecG [Myxococcota bacterium]|nr:ATP-dependent DNA helicase RecG [Myxococcota bacterium]